MNRFILALDYTLDKNSFIEDSIMFLQNISFSSENIALYWTKSRDLIIRARKVLTLGIFSIFGKIKTKNPRLSAYYINADNFSH